MANPVVHFEVLGKDGPRLQKFFGELFGWKINTDNPMNYGIVNPQDNESPGEGMSHIGGGVGQAPEGYDGHVTFYVGVDDVEAALAKAEELGGTRVFGPETMNEPPLTLGQFKDPEGNLIGLVKGM